MPRKCSLSLFPFLFLDWGLFVFGLGTSDKEEFRLTMNTVDDPYMRSTFYIPLLSLEKVGPTTTRKHQTHECNQENKRKPSASELLKAPPPPPPQGKRAAGIAW